VLVLSTHRADKENAMLSTREERFLVDIEKLQHSIETGHIKVAAKVMERIGRLKEKYKGFQKLYDIQLILSDD
jgi:ribosomal protein L31